MWKFKMYEPTEDAGTDGKGYYELNFGHAILVGYVEPSLKRPGTFDGWIGLPDDDILVGREYPSLEKAKKAVEKRIDKELKEMRHDFEAAKNAGMGE